jgi:hypothetical protein
MVGPNGFEPSTSSVSRKRSGPTELRAYTGVCHAFASEDTARKYATNQLEFYHALVLVGSLFIKVGSEMHIY